MINDPAYTACMKNATRPHGTGGNPKIGVPVTYNRPKFFFPLAQPLSCSPCPHTPNSNPPPVLSCSQACLINRQHASPHDDIRAHVLQTLQSPSSEGLTAYRVSDLACTLFSSPISEPITPALPTVASSFPPNPYRDMPYKPFPVDPSHPSMFPSPFCLDSTPALTLHSHLPPPLNFNINSHLGLILTPLTLLSQPRHNLPLPPGSLTPIASKPCPLILSLSLGLAPRSLCLCPLGVVVPRVSPRQATPTTPPPRPPFPCPY
jgi:hypothetical protein